MERQFANSSPNGNRAVLLLGPTGSGKTPLGRIIQQRGLWGADCLHFDFGANLREVVDRNRPDDLIGRADLDFLRRVLETGALLEDEQFPVAERILRRFMTARATNRRTQIILNGLPRHAGQARAIDGVLDVRALVHLECSRETVLQRIRSNVGRDRTGRKDDGPESVGDKLKTFAERTKPLLAYYRRRGARLETIHVTGTMTPEQMWESLGPRGGHGRRCRPQGRHIPR